MTPINGPVPKTEYNGVYAINRNPVNHQDTVTNQVTNKSVTLDSTQFSVGFKQDEYSGATQLYMTRKDADSAKPEIVLNSMGVYADMNVQQSATPEEAKKLVDSALTLEAPDLKFKLPLSDQRKEQGYYVINPGTNGTTEIGNRVTGQTQVLDKNFKVKLDKDGDTLIDYLPKPGNLDIILHSDTIGYAVGLSGEPAVDNKLTTLAEQLRTPVEHP